MTDTMWTNNVNKQIKFVQKSKYPIAIFMSIESIFRNDEDMAFLQ